MPLEHILGQLVCFKQLAVINLVVGIIKLKALNKLFLSEMGSDSSLTEILYINHS